MIEALFALWWAWLALALVLAILEMLLSGFLALGFAIGAALIAAFLLLSPGTLGPAGLLALFGALSLVAWVALRRVFASPRGSVKHFDRDIND